MKKYGLFSAVLFICAPVFADCTVSDGISLCSAELGTGNVQILTSKKQAGDLNGDSFLDVVKVETAGGINDRLVVYLGKDCYGSFGVALCFSPPHLTAIYPVTGIELKDLDSDGKDDVIIRDGQDKIRLLSFSVDASQPTTPAGNVSLLGTYNLTPASFTASSTYPDGADALYEPAGAFDGYKFSSTVKVSGANPPGGPYGYGTWTSASGSYQNQWLRVEFSKPTKVSGFDLYAKSGFTTRLPKNITIQVSADGANYVNHEAVVATESLVQTITLTNPTPYVRYFRFYMHNTQSATDYLQLDEVLLKGWVLP